MPGSCGGQGVCSAASALPARNTRARESVLIEIVLPEAGCAGRGRIPGPSRAAGSCHYLDPARLKNPGVFVSPAGIVTHPRCKQKKPVVSAWVAHDGSAEFQVEPGEGCPRCRSGS